MAKKYLSVYIFILLIWGLSLVRAAGAYELGIRNYELGITKADTADVNNYIKLSFADKTFVPFAIYNIIEALEMSNKIKYQKGIDDIFTNLQIYKFTNLQISNECSFQSVLFNRILNNNIDLYMTLYDSLGYYYLRDGKQDKALDCFRSVERTGCLQIVGKKLALRACVPEISISERLKKSELNGIAGCYKRIGIEYLNQEDYEISIEFLNKALIIFKGLDNRIGVGSCYNNIGTSYINSGNYFLALDNLLKSLKIFENSEYKIGLASCNINIGIVYEKEKDYSKAQDYYQNGLKIYKEIKIKSGILKCYYNWGTIYSEKGNQIKAIEIYNQALKISEELQDEENMVKILNNIGDAYMKMEDYSKSLEYFNKGLKLNEKNDNKINKLFLYNNIANTNLKLKRYDEALEYALKSLKSAKDIKELFIENDGYRILTETYNLKGDYKKAKEYADLYKSTGDSLYNSEKSKQILEIQTKYETEKKDKDILLLNKNNEIKTIEIGKQKAFIIYMIGGFILIIIFALIYLYQYNQKRKSTFRHKVLETEMKALRSQMNPHFTFNVLNSIQYFISENDMESAELYIEKFASLIRMILDQSRTAYTTLEQEIIILKLYLELEEMRFEKKFNYTMNIDSNIEPGKILIPGMLVQPIVENAIKHGIKHKEGNALINISFSARNSILLCSVTDNGIGLAEAKKLNAGKTHKSTATSIIKERIDALSSIYNIRLSYKTEDLFNDDGKPEGICVTIEIPIGIKEEEFTEV